MSLKSKFICLVSLCLFCLISNVQAETWSRVKVVTATGWEYNDVTVETVPDQPYILIVNPDGASKRMSRSNISVILDAQGKDITASVLANTTGAKTSADDTTGMSTATPNSENSSEMPAASPIRRIRPMRQRPPNMVSGARYRFAISGGSGYSFASGDWFEGLTNGLSFNLCGRLTLTNNIYIGLSYRYQKLGVDSDLESSYLVYDEYGYPILISLDFDVHLNETFFLVGVMTEPYTYEKPFAFLEVGLGGMGHHIKATAASGGESASANYDETKFGMLIAVGGVIPFNQTTGLCLEGNMRLTGEGSSYSYNYEYQGSSGILFGVGVNLMIMLGK
jgi:hypothetical protein